MRLALVSAVSLALVGAPAALAAAVFVTPKKAIYCKVEATTPAALVCWRPSTGFTARMTGTGKASGAPRKAYRGLHDPKPARVLTLDRTWSRGSFSCTNRKLALICINGKGHGWALGPARGARIF